MKARKRKAPGGLRRARTKGAKRACVRRDPRPDKQLRDLLMPAVRASMSAAEASELLFAATATASFHDLWPCGPWSSAGECVARDGRLKWQWVCRTCDAKAGDSSRAVKLAAPVVARASGRSHPVSTKWCGWGWTPTLVANAAGRRTLPTESPWRTPAAQCIKLPGTEWNGLMGPELLRTSLGSLRLSGDGRSRTHE